ncbi:MAG: 4-alpha-glucanotransferase [Acidobacteriota bacterium]
MPATDHSHPSPPRRAGILLHPTSLPGRFGLGDLGPSVDTFLDWLVDAGQSLWQVLPLGPPAVYGAPYTTLSAFAGNPALLSPEILVDDGLLTPRDIEPPRALAEHDPTRAAYGLVEPWKDSLLRVAFERAQADDTWSAAIEHFAASPAQAPWLDDWCLFRSLKHALDDTSWTAWPEPLRTRDRTALDKARAEHADEIAFQRFVQCLFDRQWRRVRRAARRRGLEIMGDLPIYVAHDSADVWAHQHLFDLDTDGLPRHVAGVPPDYFSETGQLWGNPLYLWEPMDREGYQWWIDRVRANLRQADCVRLDHFRAFAGFWQVPAEDETAAGGRWVEGPGLPLFDALWEALGDLPIIAEDLGEITDDVHALREALGFPGMRVLQFGFGAEPTLHTPHNHEVDCVVYTGTHDNDTAVGWYRSLPIEDRERLHRYTGSTPRAVHWTLLRQAYASVAQLAITPIQDVLGLGSEARINTPGRAEGNWHWRLRDDQLHAGDAARLRSFTEIFGRTAVGERDDAPDLERPIAALAAP